MRFATPMHEKTAPFYYYLPIILAGLLPWLAYLPKAWRSLSHPLKSLYSREEIVFLVTWIGFILLFYSFSSSKLLPYIAPVFLPLTVFLGPIFQHHDERRTPVFRGWKEILKDESPVWLMAALFLILIFIPPFLKSHDVPLTFGQWWPWIIAPVFSLLALCLLPVMVVSNDGEADFRLRLVLTAIFLLSLLLPTRYFLAPYRSAYAVSQAVNLYVPADVLLYQYRMSLYGIDFYSLRRSVVVEDIGELTYGVNRLPVEEKKVYFLSADEFSVHCRQAKETFCVAEHKDNLERLKTMAKRVNVLWTNQHFYLLHLKND